MGTSVGVFGRGRLGTSIRAAIDGSPDLHCAWSLGRDDVPPAHAPVDVAIDVSHADGVGEHLAWASEHSTDLVIGATGWPVDLLQHHPGTTGVLVAPNFSLSMALLGRFASVLGGYAAASESTVDLAVTETHHRHKADAPSGSAHYLVGALARAAQRPRDDIATTSLRLGEVIGRHDVHYESADESIRVTHQAHHRDVFATGALTTIRWIHGRRGVYGVQDWAADHLDHLFTAITVQEHL